MLLFLCFCVQRYRKDLIIANLLTYFNKKVLAIRDFFINFASVKIYILTHENGYIHGTESYSDPDNRTIRL